MTWYVFQNLQVILCKGKMNSMFAKHIQVTCLSFLHDLVLSCAHLAHSLETPVPLNRPPNLFRLQEFGGGTNPCDVGLDLSGSWQQGHSATYNAPSRI
jgi:hypothetical protein